MLETRPRWLGYLKAAGLVAATTLLCLPLAPWLSPTNLVMFYLLAVVVAALYWGRGPAVLVSALGVLAFNFAFVPPRFSFAVAHSEYLLTFLALFVVGLVISGLTARAQGEAEAAQAARLVEATERLQRALLNSVSHDLRSPLAAITGALSALEEDSEGLDAASRASLVDTARGEAERLNRLVGKLLDWSRLEAGALTLDKTPVDLEDLAGSALDALGRRLAGRPISVEAAPDLPLVRGDYVLLRQALVNVLENAIKYSPPGTPIRVRVRQQDAEAWVQVIDDGPGIPPDALDRIFEAFVRAAGPGAAGGTGLGLAIARGIVEAHGGRVWAENRPKGGAVLTIALPCDDSVAGAAA